MTTTATDEEIETAILAALAGEAPRAWSDIRAVLPPAQFWVVLEALGRLQAAGRVDVVKVDGRNFVDLSLVPETLRARGIQ